MTALIKRVRIIQVIAETSDARTFVLEPLDGWIPTYKAGQFMTFLFKSVGGEKRRSYSISSSPALNEPLSITIKKVVNGEFSRHMLEHYREGDILYTTGINGFFCLPEKPGNDTRFFFLVAGSGITPAFSLIKTILHTSNASIVLIYSNRSEADTIFLNKLSALQLEHGDRFILQLLMSNRFDIHKSRLSNSMLQSLLGEYVVDKKNSLFYVCGPLTYMQMVTITLVTEGISRQNIKTESFDSTPRARKNVPPNVSAHKVTIRMDDQVHELTVQYPQSILSAAKEAHIELPYSCDTGRCGSCVATCTSGKVWMAYNEVLMDVEIEKGLILTCQGYPLEDVSITI